MPEDPIKVARVMEQRITRPGTRVLERPRRKAGPFVMAILVAVMISLAALFYFHDDIRDSFRPAGEGAEMVATQKPEAAGKQEAATQQRDEQAAEARQAATPEPPSVEVESKAASADAVVASDQQKDQQEAKEKEVEARRLAQEEQAKQQEAEQHQQEEAIQALLSGAGADLQALRLASPAGNNALEKYKKVLELVPEHPQAKQGVQDIVSKYIELAKQAAGEKARDEAQRKAEEEKQKGSPALAGEMVAIPAGTFNMGSNSGDEAPVHSVSIPAFRLGKYEVTRGQFATFVNETGYNAGDKCWTFENGEGSERSGRNWQNPGFQQEDSHPAVCLNWDDARAYAEWLSGETGGGYRLPSEAEWEYACRSGGREEEYCGGA
ncbi:MAG TPA: SUMF1/EgtB/PvdO family nonheme iron enzyme, partial [Candidatus Glassbacteria bacterium]|nr:SUMF1/EgtB/PvdO family nonheme iron enzyme [Candidatus Glassbacteria bacterium]